MIQHAVLDGKSWQVCAGGGRETEEENEPGNFDLSLAAGTSESGQPRHVGGGKKRDRNDPKRARQFHGGADSERLRSVFRGRSDHRTGVVNREGGPETELILAQMQGMANRGKEKQGDRVEQKDCPHGDTDLFLIRAGNRGNGGDRASATDGSARGDQEGSLSGDLKQAAKEQAKQHGARDADRRVKETGTAGVHDLLQVHAKSQGNDGHL